MQWGGKPARARILRHPFGADWFLVFLAPAPGPAAPYFFILLSPMNIFINDIPLVIKKLSEKVYKHKFDLVLNPEDDFTSKDLVGDVLVRDAGPLFIDRLLRLMEVKKLKKLKSLTMLVKKKKFITLHLKDQFKIAKAGGGLVVKGDQVLMIYRLGKWDLPKGKLKSDEDQAAGALREVEEETNIKLELGEELPSTWHSYAYKGNKMLKKTSWFLMKCLDDSLMKPQTEEYIEEVRWMSPQEALAKLEDSYASISLVVRHYVTSLAGQPVPAKETPAAGGK